jgi:hypothetical protein
MKAEQAIMSSIEARQMISSRYYAIASMTVNMKDAHALWVKRPDP